MTAFVKIDSIAIDFYRAIHYSAYVKHGLAIACRPSVRLSVCDVGGLWSHKLEILETNSTHLQDILPENYVWKKLTKCSNCTRYLPEKNIKIPEFFYDIYPNN